MSWFFYSFVLILSPWNGFDWGGKMFCIGIATKQTYKTIVIFLSHDHNSDNTFNVQNTYLLIPMYVLKASTEKTKKWFIFLEYLFFSLWIKSIVTVMHIVIFSTMKMISDDRFVFDLLHISLQLSTFCVSGKSHEKTRKKSLIALYSRNENFLFFFFYFLADNRFCHIRVSLTHRR